MLISNIQTTRMDAVIKVRAINKKYYLMDDRNRVKVGVPIKKGKTLSIRMKDIYKTEAAREFFQLMMMR